MDEGRKDRSGGKPPRAQRLKAALRENLRRRKVQARGRHTAQGSQGGQPDEIPVRQPGNDTDK